MHLRSDSFHPYAVLDARLAFGKHDPDGMIALGGIIHETHSFATTPTRLAEFAGNQLYHGEAVLSRMRGTRAGTTDGLTQTGSVMGTVAMGAFTPGICNWQALKVNRIKIGGMDRERARIGEPGDLHDPVALAPVDVGRVDGEPGRLGAPHREALQAVRTGRRTLGRAAAEAVGCGGVSQHDEGRARRT